VILEHALLPVKPGEEAAFESAFAEAKAIIAGTPGFLRFTLSRCLEHPNTFVLLVEWDRLGTIRRASAARPSTKSGADCCTPSTSPFR
jgi:heme-degrading monooxygenase HmoA